MDPRREDSVLVALSELRKIQDERRREEEAEERRKEEELRLAREEEERRAAEEAERRRRHEEEENRRAAVARALLEREERIRIQEAAARAEAEARVRAEREQRRCQAVLEAQRRSRVPWRTAGIALSVVALGVWWAIYSMLGQVRSATELAERRGMEALAARNESEILRVRLEEKTRSLDTLREERARTPAAGAAEAPGTDSSKNRSSGGEKRGVRAPTGGARNRADAKASETKASPTISVEIDPLNPLVGIPEE